MRNSAAKRIIAVLLCLVVFAGSELSGLTNIVGDLFAEETTTGADEGDRDNAIETIDIEDTSDDVVEEVEVTEEAAPEAEPEETVESSESEAEPEAPAEDAVVEEAPSDTPEAEENVETPVDETENQGEETPADTEQKDDAADASDVENNDNVSDSSDAENNEDVSDTDDAETKDDAADVNDIENKENTETPGDAEVTEGEETSDITNTPEGEEVPAEEDIKDEQEVLPEELEEPTNPEEDITYPEFADKYSDDKVEIQVNAEEGVLPEGVILSVTPIVKQDVEELEAKEDITQEELDQVKEINEKYDTTAEKLEETVADDDTKNIAGFLAYDISFFITETDEETGEETQVEIEPNGNVNVTMDFADGYLPEELAENEAVSVSSVDVVHMKEEDGEVQPEVLTDAAVDTTENAEVKTAEFTVDSFSAFVIVWGSNEGGPVGVNFANIDGYPLEIIGEIQDLTFGMFGYTLQLEQGSIFDVSEIRTEGKWESFYKINAKIQDSTSEPKTYIFSRMIFGEVSAPTGIVTEIRCQDGNVQWKGEDSEDWKDTNGYSFSMVYTDSNGEEDLLHVIDKSDLLDSKSKGVKILMNNYAFSDETVENGIGINAILGLPKEGESWYAKQDAEQGLVENTLQGGFPVTSSQASKEGESLEKWFKSSDSQEANYLFRKDKYDEDGVFYFSSFENYAYLQGDGNFKLYDEVGTPAQTSDAIYANRGNFFPYNTIEKGTSGKGDLSSCKVLYDENGEFLNDPNPRDLYIIQGQYPDCHFSMYLETYFIQGKGGQYKGRDMVYEFNGDDDLWVFIDDVLVLDIGGNHAARGGTINFATGEVKVRQSGINPTTIKRCFVNAEREGTVEWKGDTFADNSTHELKMFYMERNAQEKVGGSNLKISFNLETVEESQIKVTKQLSGTTQPQYANVPFDFKVMAQKVIKTETNGKEVYSDNEYEPLTGVKVVDDEGQQISVGTDGVFQLKPGQSAWFSELQVERKYYVVELGVNKDAFNDKGFKVDETSYENFYENDATSGSIIGAKTDIRTVGSRKSVVFTNECSTEIVKDLKITKKIQGAEEGNERFEFKVWLEKTNGKLVPYEGDYYLKKDGAFYTYNENGEILQVSAEEKCGTASNGQIYIPAGYTASIRDLLAGTGFYVEEILSEAQKEIYTTVNKTIKEGTSEQDTDNSRSEDGKVADAAITKDKDAEVTITNMTEAPQNGELQITKVMKQGDPVRTEPFMFQIKTGTTDELEVYAGNYYLKDKEGNFYQYDANGLPEKIKDGRTICETVKDGKIRIPVGFTASFPELPVGTRFEVNEILSEEEQKIFNAPQITVSGADAITNKDSTVTGTITAGQTASITVTNSQKSYSYTWEIVKVGSAAGTKPLEGAEFTLTSAGETPVIYTGTSGKDGILIWQLENQTVDIKDFAPGSYTLKETKAPTGYMISGREWTVILSYEGIKVEESTEDGKSQEISSNTSTTGADGKQKYSYEFYNEAVYELPSTGGAGIFWYMVSGTLLMMAGILILYKRKYAGRC